MSMQALMCKQFISEELYLKISPGRFHYLKNLLEGYDGLAILSSVDMSSGLVRLKFGAENRRIVIDFLQAEAKNIKSEIYKTH